MEKSRLLPITIVSFAFLCLPASATLLSLKQSDGTAGPVYVLPGWTELSTSWAASERRTEELATGRTVILYLSFLPCLYHVFVCIIGLVRLQLGEHSNARGKWRDHQR